jgi:hypothetical protein
MLYATRKSFLAKENLVNVAELTWLHERILAPQQPLENVAKAACYWNTRYWKMWTYRLQVKLRGRHIGRSIDHRIARLIIHRIAKSIALHIGKLITPHTETWTFLRIVKLIALRIAM